jgi:hypothetical protein
LPRPRNSVPGEGGGVRGSAHASRRAGPALCAGASHVAPRYRPARSASIARPPARPRRPSQGAGTSPRKPCNGPDARDSALRTTRTDAFPRPLMRVERLCLRPHRAWQRAARAAGWTRGLAHTHRFALDRRRAAAMRAAAVVRVGQPGTQASPLLAVPRAGGVCRRTCRSARRRLRARRTQGRWPAMCLVLVPCV